MKEIRAWTIRKGDKALVVAKNSLTSNVALSVRRHIPLQTWKSLGLRSNLRSKVLFAKKVESTSLRMVMSWNLDLMFKISKSFGKPKAFFYEDKTVSLTATLQLWSEH